MAFNSDTLSTPFFVKRDLDGFFGLAVDNAVQILLIVNLLPIACGMPLEFIYQKILPGTALSVLFGNLFYSFQAYRLAKKEGRPDATALPYGINTLSLFAFIFFVMAPVYQQTKSAELAWQMGMVACLLSGVIEFFGAFIAPWVRRWTPRTSLLSALAGIAIAFIAMDFAFQCFEHPFIALIPLAIILLQYFSRIRFPMGISGGLVAVMVGGILAWALGLMDFEKLAAARTEIKFYSPPLYYSSLYDLLIKGAAWKYLTIIIPMGVFNLFGSLQNLESAEAAGDRYGNVSSLTVNGLGSMLAAVLGSCFPTTIYIGHPGWKSLGARSGYSTLNGIFIATLCLTGLVQLMAAMIPVEAGIGIVLWIGIIIVAQAFQSTGYRHAPAVAFGLLPGLAAWGTVLVQAALRAADSSLEALGNATLGAYTLKGMLSLQSGFLFGAMIWAALATYLIDRKFWQAAAWSLLAGCLAYTGVIHAYRLQGNDILFHFGWGIRKDMAIVYAVMAGIFVLAALFRRSGGLPGQERHFNHELENTDVERHEQSLVHGKAYDYKT